MKTIEQVMQAAQHQGVLPADAVAPMQESRPWPVVILTAIGAWFAAMPLLAMIQVLLGDMVRQGVGPYVIGLLVLGAAVTILRSNSVPLFVEQLAVPALLVGGGTLATGLFRDLTTASAALLLAVIAVGIALSAPRAWLRMLLGMLACGLVVLASVPESRYWHNNSLINRLWLGWHVAFAAWLACHWAIAHCLMGARTARTATALDALSTGWILATLIGLAFWSGMTFLLGAAIGIGGAHAGAPPVATWDDSAIRAVSVLLALGASGWLALRWPALRRLWCAGAAIIVAGLAWQLPALGATVCVVAYCASTGRLKMAVAAALAAAWIVGSYYYQLNYPLEVKALRLIGAGTVLGLLAWIGAAKDVIPAGKHEAIGSRGGIGIAVGAVLVIVVANGAIWQKENLIANGKAVYVELAPVDPRSLMQGDFMRLNYRLPLDDNARAASMVGASRPHVVAVRDARGVATLVRMHDGKTLGAHEFLIELTPHSGGWMLVSDAWFFREGEARRWASARYGEFRVTPDGRALLVGLRGPNLEKL
jgi:uncharacterized membrane-anchored protein